MNNNEDKEKIIVIQEEYQALINELNKNIQDILELKQKYCNLISEIETMKKKSIKLIYGNGLKYKIVKWLIR